MCWQVINQCNFRLKKTPLKKRLVQDYPSNLSLYIDVTFQENNARIEVHPYHNTPIRKGAS